MGSLSKCLSKNQIMGEDDIAEVSRLYKSNLAEGMSAPDAEKAAARAVLADLETVQASIWRQIDASPMVSAPTWLETEEINTPEGPTSINRYFVENPDMMLGKMRLIGSMYGKGEPVLIGSSDNLDQKIMEAVRAGMPENAMTERGTTLVDMRPVDTETEGIKDGAYYVKGKDLYRKVAGVGEPQSVPKAQREKIEMFLGLRDVVNEMLAIQGGLKDAKPGRMAALREALNESYDGFVKAHGPIKKTIVTKQNRKDGKEVIIKRFPNISAFEDDPDAYKVAEIEVYDEKADTAKKAAIFTQDIVSAYVPPDVQVPADALAVSLNEVGRVDIPLIADRLGLTEAEALAALGDQVFLDPVGEQYRTSSEYLAGDVVGKLETARTAAETNPAYTRNVSALEAVQPEPLTRADIRVSFGAPYVPVEIYEQYLTDVLKARRIKLRYDDVMARWYLVEGSFPPESEITFGTNRRKVADLVEAALNSATITITNKDHEGKPVRDGEAEAEARAKVDIIKDTFSGDPEQGIEGWLWGDYARATRIEASYNNLFNRIVQEKHDGSHLTFPGLSRAVTAADGSTFTIDLKPHRVNAIWKVIKQGNTLFNHAVGSGKAQPFDAKVLTPDGWKRMGDVQVGDQVISADGNPTTVLGVYPQGEKEIFKVVFSDGSSTECCDEHLWLTQTYSERSAGQRAVKLGKKWKSGEGKVRALSDIRKTLVAPHLNAKNHSIPMVAPVALNARPVPLDPYLVGVLIGDGCLRAREITFSTADAEILESVKKALPPQCEVRYRSGYDYAICYTGEISFAKRIGGNAGFRGVAYEAVRSHPVALALDELGMRGKYAHEKRVPEAYLNNSIEVRTEVLRGLMDTDGTVDGKGYGVTFCTSSPGLAEDVAYLVQSLGGIVGRSTKRIAGYRDATILSVTLPPEINPFRLSRKAERVKPKSKYIPVRYIVGVVPVGTKPAQCLAVSNPSHLYVTDDFVVTHNTWTSIMASMEMKRLGMIQRPMFVVPNHMLNQFSTEFYQAYPNAKLLIATKDQMSAKNRKRFAARIAADTWDGIIITHSSFGKMGLSKEAYQDYYREQMEELEQSMKAAQDEGNDSAVSDMMRKWDKFNEELGGDSDAVPDGIDVKKKKKRAPTIKEKEGKKDAAKEKLKKLVAEEDKDDGVTFEETGIDFLFVDEAHLMKSLPFATMHTRIKGIGGTASKRAVDLFLKMRHLEKSRPGRSAVFMTGTPVSNTMAELYTMQRYLQGPTLKKFGIDKFDAWAGTFGKIVVKSELASNSRDYKDTESFSEFVNMPELMTIAGSMMDTQTAEMLKLPRPELKGGKLDVVQAQLSPDEEGAINALIEKMETRDKDEPFLPLFTAGIQLATDMRLVDPTAPFNPNGKIAKAVDNIFSIWEEGNADPAAPNKGQLVFLDMGVPGSKGKAKATIGASNETEAGPQDDAESALEQIRREIAEEAGQVEEGEAVEIDDDQVEIEALLRGKFNLYQDIKDKLIAKGVPKEQIAFIHDAKNDDQKAKMFEKMRSGDIRVMIGSTGKMGVGTNVQKLLYAMHHLDAPWRPADLEQRDGRILRQGNKNKEVRIFRYITVKSFDAYRWQLLDRKSQFIGQLYAGAAGVRHMEDITPPLPEAAELKAAATGNPLIIERAELEREVKKLEVAERTHYKTQKSAAESVKRLQNKVASLKAFNVQYEQDVPRVEDLRGDAFKVKLDTTGKPTVVDDRKKAGEFVKRYVLGAGQQWYKTIVDLGEISSFAMRAEIKKTLNGVEVMPMIEGTAKYQADQPFVVGEDADPGQVIQRWVRLVTGVPAYAAKVSADIARDEDTLPKMQEAAQPRPFPQTEKLVEKRKRLETVIGQLDPKSAVNTPGTPENLQKREDAARARMAEPDYKAAANMAGNGVDTSLVPGFNPDHPDHAEWRANRVYTERDAMGNVTREIRSFDAAVDYLVEGAIAKAKELGALKQDRKAFVLIGYPGAGKSTLAEPLGEQMGAIHSSADDAKLIIPEYDGGKNSGGVHQESSALAKAALKKFIQAGYNIILEKLGSDPSSITKPASQFRNAGYGVTLVHVDVPKPVAMERAIERFKRSGRAVAPEIYDDLKANEVYTILKQEGAIDENAVFAWNEPAGWGWGEVEAPSLSGISITDRFTGRPIELPSDRPVGVGTLEGSGRDQGRDADVRRTGSREGQEQRLTIPPNADPTQWVRETVSQYGIDPEAFGKGQAKPFNNLVKEVVSGETELIVSDGQLLRRVSALALDIFADVDGKRVRLTEDRQVFSDGRERRRAMEQSIGEKLEPGEDAVDSIARALDEELGIKSFQRLDEVKRTDNDPMPSPSYPGLMSQYTIYKASVLIDPSEYQPEYQEVQKDKTNFFTWKPVEPGEGDAMMSLKPARPVEGWFEFTRSLKAIAIPPRIILGEFRVETRAGHGTLTYTVHRGRARTSREVVPTMSAADETQIGRFYLRTDAAPDGFAVSVQNMSVDPEYQGRGIATSIFDMIEADIETTGVKLVPPALETLSEDGKAFWSARDPEALANRERMERDVYFGGDVSARIGVNAPGVVTTPAMGAKRAEFEAELLRLAKRIKDKGVQVEVQNRIQIGKYELNGYYDSGRKLIKIALENGLDNALTTIRHEEIHALRDLGLITDAEWKLLTEAANKARVRADIGRETLTEYRQSYAAKVAKVMLTRRGFVDLVQLPWADVEAKLADMFGFDPANRVASLKSLGLWDEAVLQNLLDEEAVAVLVSERMGGQSYGTTVDGIIDQIAQFIERLTNALRGLGFKTVEDVFRAIDEGTIGQRDGNARQDAGLMMSQRDGGDVTSPLPQSYVEALNRRIGELGRAPQIEEVWGPKFQKLMSGQYQIAVAGSDYSTQYDILSAKYNNSTQDGPEMRAAIRGELLRLESELGQEWVDKYAYGGVAKNFGGSDPLPDNILASLSKWGNYQPLGIGTNPQYPNNETEAPEKGLSDVVADAVTALGLEGMVRQGRLDPAMKRAARKMGGDMMGQTSRATGVVRLALKNDMATLAHEGGHALEIRASVRDDLNAIKTQFAEDLTVPPAPNAPAPMFPQTGFSGIELDQDSIGLAIASVDAERQMRVLAAELGALKSRARSRQEEARFQQIKPMYEQFQNIAGGNRETLVRRFGADRADAILTDLMPVDRITAPSYAATRFSKSGQPAPRVVIPPSDVELSEGFAEWFRIYLTNPKQAQALSRGFYDSFEDMLDATEPEMLTRFQMIQQEIDTLAKAAPVSAVRARVQSTVQPGLIESIRLGLSDAADAARIAAETARRTGDASQVGSALSAFSAEIWRPLGDRLYGFYHAAFDSRHPMKKAVQFLIDKAVENSGTKLGKGERAVVKALHDPYKLWRLAEHSKTHATAALQFGIVHKGKIDPSGPSYWDALTQAFGGSKRGQWNDDMAEQFGSYLIGRRMLAEFARYDRGELENIPDTIITREVWQKATAQLEKEYPQFKAAAKTMYGFGQELLKYKFENGFLTPEQYAEYSNRIDYAPLNRIMDAGTPSMLGGSSNANKRRLIYRFQGSTRDFINPLETIAQDMFATQQRVEMNRVIGAMDRMARAAGPGGGAIAERIPAKEMKATRIRVADVASLAKPLRGALSRTGLEKADRDSLLADAQNELRDTMRLTAMQSGLSIDDQQMLLDTVDLLFDGEASKTIFKATDISEGGEPIVYLWEGGQRIPIRMGDNEIAQDIFEGFQAFGSSDVNPIVDMAALGTQALRAGITKAPSYVLVNYLRDQLSTWVLSENFTPFVTGARGLRSVLTNDVAAKRYGAFAGLMGGIDAQLIDESANKHDVLTLRRRGFFAVPAKSGIGQVWQRTLKAMEITEAGTRFGHFEAAFNRAVADGLTEEEAAFEAAYAAHDVIDFSRRGSKTMQVSRIVAFLNAALQGIDSTRRGLSGERDSYTNYRDLITPYVKAANGMPLSVAEKKAVPSSAKVVGKMMVLGMIGLALSMLYKDDEEYEEFNDYMKATHWFFKINDTWYRFPKPFDLAIFSQIFEGAFDRFVKEDPRAGEKFMQSLKHTMVPPHEINVANLYYEMATGIDTFRNREIVPMDISKLPPELQFGAYTSEFGRMIGSLTGMSPQKVDHLMGGLFGTIGRDIQSLSDIALPAANEALGGVLPGVSDKPRAQKSLEDMAILSRFTRRAARGSLSSEIFWKQMKMNGGEYVSAAEGYKALRNTGRGAEARDLLANVNPDQKAFAILEGEFSEKEQDIHPLNRAKQVMSAMSGIRKEMVLGRLYKGGLTPKDAEKKGSEAEEIIMPPSKQKIVNEILEDLSMREARNALVAVGFPGWAQKDIMPTDGLFKELEAAAPEVAEELTLRLTKGKNKVYPFEGVRRAWGAAREELLAKGSEADLSEFVSDAKDWEPDDAPVSRPAGMMRLGGPNEPDPNPTLEVSDDLAADLEFSAAGKPFRPEPDEDIDGGWMDGVGQELNNFGATQPQN